MVADAPVVRVEIDRDEDAAYITLSNEEIVKTIVFSDNILVDLDQYGVAVGIEVLGTDTRIPLSGLAKRFHIHTSVEPILGHLLPSISTRINASATPDSTTEARTPSHSKDPRVAC